LKLLPCALTIEAIKKNKSQMWFRFFIKLEFF
jgi:hypothetical protein